MADSYVFRGGSIRTCREQRPAPVPKRRVLVTGAAGNIGSRFAEDCRDRYELVLMVRPGDDDHRIAAWGRVMQCDLADLDRLTDLCRDVDTVVHLAAAAGPDSKWSTLLPANIVGTYNVFVAARAAECRRVVYASSIHAVSGYPKGRQVQADDPVNPGDLYGVSKCFGEAMARYMALQQGLSSIVLRIGAFQPLEAARKPTSHPMMDAFVSPRDLVHLLELSVDDENLQFAILHGLSGNVFNRMDISETCELIGYEPVDDFAREHPELKDLQLSENLQSHNEQEGQKPGIRDDLARARE